MTEQTLICDTCSGQVSASHSIIEDSGHVFCCEPHQVLFSERHKDQWPEPKNTENDFQEVDVSEKQIKEIGYFLISACLAWFVLFLWGISGVFRGASIDVFFLFMVAGLTMLMGWLYCIFRRQQRAFSLLKGVERDDMEAKDLAEHIDSLYRKKEVSKKDVLLMARYAFIPELDQVAQKIRADEI